MKLRTTDTQLHDLKTTLDGVRDSSTTVKVDKEALRNLLNDHYELNLAYMRKHGVLPETAS